MRVQIISDSWDCGMTGEVVEKNNDIYGIRLENQNVTVFRHESEFRELKDEET